MVAEFEQTGADSPTVEPLKTTVIVLSLWIDELRCSVLSRAICEPARKMIGKRRLHQLEGQLWHELKKPDQGLTRPVSLKRAMAP